jgi:AcrR family transcriptional regulator
MEPVLKSDAPKRPVKKLSGDERRRQLVRIGLDLIATKGFEGLRFQEVAEQAGINNATLSYHFRTKEELIRGVLQYLGDELQKTPERPIGRPSTALEELRLEFKSMGRLLVKRPKLFLVLTELSLRALRDPELGKGMRMLDHSWQGHLSRILEDGKKEGTLRRDIDAYTAAQALMAQIKGIGFHALIDRLKPAEIEALVGQVALQAEHWLRTGD